MKENQNSQTYKMYKDELENAHTQYFILDTHGDKKGYQEEDFNTYIWSLKRYKQVNEGDLFIYRRPQAASEIPNEFYLFGAGKIEKISEFENGQVIATISKPLKFKDYVLKRDLTDVKWAFKERIGSDWQRFFNQYGMNKITKQDYMMLLQFSHPDDLFEEIIKSDFNTEKELENKIEEENYFVEDQKENIIIRGSAHNVFARRVKSNYKYECAVTGIHIKSFLVASHIVPWSVDKSNRMNPKNGICLSSLVDKAFDQGYITFSPDLKVVISDNVKDDTSLYKMLSEYEGQKINVPHRDAPGEEFLNWHRENIFMK